MYAETIFQFKKMLLNLEQLMKKAEAHADVKKFDVNVYPTLRLAPDMFPFTKQIQSVCDVAKFCTAYLAEQAPPKHEDNEATWNELKERIQKVLKYIDGFKPADFEKSGSLTIRPGWAEGKGLSASSYVEEIAIPNFYFHLMTAYAILRHAGVDVGKMDYLGKIDLK